MTTLLQLTTRAQRDLNDAGAATWAAATVEAWCIDAIRDYSQYFPRTQEYEYTVQVTDTDHVFNLPSDCQEIVLVEYPSGNDPPDYLVRRARTHEQFYDYEGYYDLERADDAASYPQIWFSEQPAAAEKWKITYLSHHDVGLASADTITVPLDHEYILILFVLWQAFKERAATAIADPDTTSNTLQKLTNASMQAEQEYRRALKIAEGHRARGGWTGPWRADVHDPIY
jgi:hypothetical protein